MLLEIETAEHARTQRDMNVYTKGWTDAAIVDCRGRNFLHFYVTKWQVLLSLFLVPWQEEHPAKRPIPLDLQKVASPPMQPIRQSGVMLEHMVANQIRRWTDCFTTEAFTNTLRMVVDLQRDESSSDIAATTGSPDSLYRGMFRDYVLLLRSGLHVGLRICVIPSIENIQPPDTD